MVKKYVLTGGPCSGKTTLLNQLKTEGYTVFPELFREVMKKNSNKYSFKVQYETFLEQQKLNHSVNENYNNEVVFFDRGIPDNIAFFKLNGLKCPLEIIYLSLPKKTKYNKIFLLDLLDFEDDGFRLEKNLRQVELTHHLISDIYMSLGYEVINVPVFSRDINESINQRKKFILENM